jgi:hypothetical protein
MQTQQHGTVVWKKAQCAKLEAKVTQVFMLSQQFVANLVSILQW